MGEAWNSNYQVELVTPASYVNYAGPISISDDEQYVYIVDKYNGPPYRLYRYDISSDGLLNRLNTSNIADGPIILHDIEYIPNFGVVTALGGSDIINGNTIDHASTYTISGDSAALSVYSDGLTKWFIY